MKNGVLVAAVVLSVASFGGMMRLKSDVETLVVKRLQAVNEQIRLKEDKRVLEAELAYLAQPVVLETFARSRGYVELPMTVLQDMDCLHGGVGCLPLAVSDTMTEVSHVAVP